MISEFEMYMILKLNAVFGVFAMLAVASGISAMITFMMMLSSMHDYIEHTAYAKLRRISIISAICSAFCLFMLIIVPTTEQMAMIKVVPMVVNSEIVSDMSEDAKELYELGIQALKDKLTRESLE